MVQVSKEYWALLKSRAEGGAPLADGAVAAVAAGVVLSNGFVCKPATLAVQPWGCPGPRGAALRTRIPRSRGGGRGGGNGGDDGSSGGGSGGNGGDGGSSGVGGGRGGGSGGNVDGGGSSGGGGGSVGGGSGGGGSGGNGGDGGSSGGGGACCSDHSAGTERCRDVAASGRRRRRGRRRGDDGLCRECLLPGHWARDCPGTAASAVAAGATSTDDHRYCTQPCVSLVLHEGRTHQVCVDV